MEYPIIALAVLIGITAQRALGFGSSPIIVPVLLVFLKPPVAITAMLLTGSLAFIIFLYGSRKNLSINRKVLTRLYVAALPGLILGAYIISHINKAPLQIIIGLLIILGAYIQEFVFPKPKANLKVSRGITIAGFGSGMLNAIAAMAFAPVLMYFRFHKVTPDQIRQNFAVLFLSINVASILFINFFKPGTLTGDGLIIFLTLLPIIFLANYFGKVISENINKKQYENAVFVAIIIAGFLTIFAGIVNL